MTLSGRQQPPLRFLNFEESSGARGRERETGPWAVGKARQRRGEARKRKGQASSLCETPGLPACLRHCRELFLLHLRRSSTSPLLFQIDFVSYQQHFLSQLTFSSPFSSLLLKSESRRLAPVDCSFRKCRESLLKRDGYHMNAECTVFSDCEVNRSEVCISQCQALES